MNAETDAEFAALRAGWRAGIPAPGPIDEAEAGAMLAVMAELGGAELVGEATTLPRGGVRAARLLRVLSCRAGAVRALSVAGAGRASGRCSRP